MKLFLITGLLCLLTLTGFQDNGYPVPPVKSGQLFYLQHSRNKNTVVYEINIDNGKPDDDKPLHPYWIRYSEKGQQEELSMFQRKFAYGIHSVKKQDGIFELNFTANKKFKMYLQKSEDNIYKVYTTINQRRAVLNRIFVNISGGSALSPNVDFVLLVGTDAITKAAVTEKRKVE